MMHQKEQGMSDGVRYHIHYTSESEGISLGVSGPSWVECLVALTDEFGDGVLPLFEKTKEELIQTAEVVGEAFESEVADAQAKINKAIADKVGEESGTGEEQSVWDKHRDSIAIFESDETAPPPATQQDMLAAEAGDDDGEDSGSDDPSPTQQECAVCGIDIDKKQANYSELMAGEPRCPDCMT